MQVPEFRSRAQEIFQAARVTPWHPTTPNEMQTWLEDLTHCVTSEIGSGYRELFSPWLKGWLETLVWLRGEYERLRAEDPGAFYEPLTEIHRAFHASQAKWKFFCAGNRCGKSQAGFQEDYWAVTGQHPWKPNDTGIQAVAIVGTDYSQYAAGVFEPKMISGETDNELAPYFPEGGKWLNAYNRKKYRITTACPDCAARGRAAKCSPTHRGRGTLALYSDVSGARSIMGAQFNHLHFDEHQSEDFFVEGNQRLGTVRGATGAITGSPLYGKGIWEHRIVQAGAERPLEENLRFPSLGPEKSPKYFDFFQISQYAAGLRTKDEIDAEAATMPDHERRARIDGEPTPLAKNPVFDVERVGAAKDQASTFARGTLHSTEDVSSYELAFNDLDFVEDNVGPLHVLKHPTPQDQFIIGVDTAAGLAKSENYFPDYSCASVMRMFNDGGKLCLEKVAEWHGYILPSKFAEEVKKLGIYFNAAWLVIETTGGLGGAVLEALRSEKLAYPKIYVDKSRPQQKQIDPGSKFGIDTNVSTKPLMIAAMQSMFLDGRLKISHNPTLDEMIAFSQTRPEGGRMWRYEAAEGEKDDRVLSTSFTCYAISQAPYLFDFDSAALADKEPEKVSFRQTKWKQDYDAPDNTWKHDSRVEEVYDLWL